MLTDPPHILSRLKVDKASLVDNPANEGALIMIAKRRKVQMKKGIVEDTAAVHRVEFDTAVREVMRREGIGRGDALKIAFRDHSALAVNAGHDRAFVLEHRALAFDANRRMLEFEDTPLTPEMGKAAEARPWGETCSREFDRLARIELAKNKDKMVGFHRFEFLDAAEK